MKKPSTPKEYALFRIKSTCDLAARAVSDKHDIVYGVFCILQALQDLAIVLDEDAESKVSKKKCKHGK